VICETGDAAADGNVGTDGFIDVVDMLDDNTGAEAKSRAVENTRHSGARGGIRTRARVRADYHVAPTLSSAATSTVATDVVGAPAPAATFEPPGATRASAPALCAAFVSCQLDSQPQSPPRLVIN
jgi:hypothetical protein